MKKDLKKQLELIELGTEDILIREELEKAVEASMEKNVPLKVKLGLDPTAPDIHLGHTVVLNKLRTFQDLGHKAILIIGDYTARIGDPSGRSSLRPKLSAETIDKNAETYMEQAFKILDPDKTEVVKNSRWLQPLKFEDILSLTSRFTVARMLERDDFKKRFKGNISIAIMELLYPIMQAYDSVAIKADIELGGTDQRFNLLMGRELQKDMGQRPQIAITMPILVGTDGTNKMSKSLGNYIGVAEKPSEIFGKIMSIPDNVMIDYFKLLTRLDNTEILSIEDDMKSEKLNPSLAKRHLSKIIIGYLHSTDDAEEAEKSFDLVFKRKEIPEEIEEFRIKKEEISNKAVWIIKLLVDSGIVKSNGEARRLIAQGAIKVDGQKITDDNMEIGAERLNEKILQRGKRHFRKIIID
ncbi:MAG TPA: tyrosine--tRNA ligase [Actinobacteria bacterium]|nr:tyrosine--tRNA ligase [Actinomycetota bacterium]